MLGVLIALGAQQLAEDWQGRSRARGSIAAVDAELATNAGVFEERTLQQPCEERRLSEIRALVSAARTTRRLPRISGIGKSIARPTLRAAWEEAQDSDVLDRWPRQDRISVAALYSQQAPSDALTLRETEQWLRLQSMMQMMTGPISDGDLTLLADVIADLTFYSWNNGIDASQEFAMIIQRGIRPSYFVVLDRKGSRAEMQALVAKSLMCQPLQLSSAD
ncbi:MAG: hypothetical protein ABIT69_07875 [Sphingomicrobium sp.]